MSGKKWGLRKLGNFKRKIQDEFLLGKGNVGIGELPITWNEFNKLYFSSRPVVVECPCELWDRVEQLMCFYSALRQLFASRRIGVFSTRYDGRDRRLEAYSQALLGMAGSSGRKMAVMKPLCVFGYPPDEDVLPKRADDWIMCAFGSSPSQALNIMDIVEKTDGFKKWDEDKYRIKSSWEMGPRKKVVILCGRYVEEEVSTDIYPFLKEKYGDRFVFIDYTPEKELVDNWFKENEGIVDPLFDIRIAESSIDKRKVFTYIATNHLYKLREYNKLFPDEVAKWLNPEELRELYL